VRCRCQVRLGEPLAGGDEVHQVAGGPPPAGAPPPWRSRVAALPGCW
jgi:hypothetical protein